MAQTTQIIVSGFHRSGTSMAMQALSRAGVFTGDRLIGADISNPDGHFEDHEVVRLHNDWLGANHSDWCHTGHLPKVEDQQANHSIGSLVQRFESEMEDSKSQVWGFKDPRAALFLCHWFRALDNPYGVFVYRHFASCLRSLQRRQANELLLNPSTRYNDMRFWSNPEVALASWLLHNNALLEMQALYPERCILVSQEAQIGGYDLAANVGEKFDLPLASGVLSGVDANKTYQAANTTLTSLHWKNELIETWDKLQSVAVAPASSSPVVEWTSHANRCKESQPDVDQLHRLWDEIGIEHAA